MGDYIVSQLIVMMMIGVYAFDVLLFLYFIVLYKNALTFGWLFWVF